MSYYNDSELGAAIIGKSVSAVWFGEEYITFETDAGDVSYYVDGDCCSNSYFFDFYGVQNLLSNGPVTAFEGVDLAPGDPGYHNPDCGYSYPGPSTCGYQHDSLEVYGYRLTTEHPTLGAVSSVLSFRNDSNGYYGGSMHLAEGGVRSEQEKLTADKVG